MAETTTDPAIKAQTNKRNSDRKSPVRATSGKVADETRLRTKTRIRISRRLVAPNSVARAARAAKAARTAEMETTTLVQTTRAEAVRSNPVTRVADFLAAKISTMDSLSPISHPADRTSSPSRTSRSRKHPRVAMAAVELRTVANRKVGATAVWPVL